MTEDLEMLFQIQMVAASEFAGLEEKVNSWLREHQRASIVDIKYQDNVHYASAMIIYGMPIEKREE